MIVRCRAVIAVLVTVRVALDVDVAGHDEEAVLDAHHLDLRAVEARKHRSGDDFVDGADHRRAGAEIEHAVDRVDQRIELVGAEDDRDLQFVAQPPRDVDDVLLVGRIERDQRFVEQQQPRPAEQRLAQQQALALAARELADRAARQSRARRRDRAPSRFRAASPCRGARSRSARRSPRWRRRRSRSDAGPARARGSAACSRSMNFPAWRADRER